MTATTTDDRTPSRPGLGLGVVVLLALAVFINYVDRGNLATAAPLIKDELKLSNTQLGYLLSSFFWIYTPGVVFAGWLAERIGAYRTLAMGLLLWSAATALSGLATSFAALMALRLLLGLGESAAFPCSSKLIGQHLPQHRLGAANGLVTLGIALGPAFGVFVGGLALATLGWRGVFIVFGLVSMLWLVPWLLVMRRAGRAKAGQAAAPAASFMEILRRPEIWGAGIGQFCMNYGVYFVLSWLPTYLIKARGFTVPQMAVLGGEIYLVYAASSLATGWLSDLAIKAGAGVTLVRKGAMMLAAAITAGAMAICAVGDAQMATAALFAAAVAFGMCTPTVFAIGQTLAGPRAAGKWISLQNAMANIAGIVAPIVTGRVVDVTGAFSWAFIVAAGVSILGLAIWGLAIRRVEPLAWTGG